MLQPDQRAKVDLSGMIVQGVTFSQNVLEALGTIVQQTSVEPPVYLVELLFSFKDASGWSCRRSASIRVAEPHTRRSRGSRKSRRLSPTTLNAMVRLRMASPGNVAIHHWSR
jgi:hypothetical protein